MLKPCGSCHPPQPNTQRKTARGLRRDGRLHSPAQPQMDKTKQCAGYSVRLFLNKLWVVLQTQ